MKKVYSILIVLMLALFSSAFSQDAKELDFIAGDQDNKITETTKESSSLSASVFKVGKDLVKARLRKIEQAGDVMQFTWRLPSVVNGKLVFTVNDKVWRETIGVVDCKLALISKKLLTIVPAQAEKLVEEK